MLIGARALQSEANQACQAACPVYSATLQYQCCCYCCRQLQATVTSVSLCRSATWLDASLSAAQVAKQSNAARSMCLWVRALDVYGRMVKVVEPKRQALHQAETALAEVEAQLTAKREQLRS